MMIRPEAANNGECLSDTPPQEAVPDCTCESCGPLNAAKAAGESVVVPWSSVAYGAAAAIAGSVLACFLAGALLGFVRAGYRSVSWLLGL